MKAEFLELATLKGLQNIKVIEKDSELTIIFNLISRCSKMNKIGQSFKNAFGSEKIGWGGNWISIIK
tara:strand:- start:199 stop:399 length:201 start_codon:yes stop_codon:yes gene_type:complete